MATAQAVTSDLLSPDKHAFFKRPGGVSQGIYSGLNCGVSSLDDPAAVRENRRRAAIHLNVEVSDLVTVRQVHGTDVHIVRDAADCEGVEADALVTATPGIAIGVLTADCQPVLMADEKAGVVAAVHAGWRGALSGVLENTVRAMESLGAKREDTVCVVGPCISQRAYEVGPDFLDEFLNDNDEFSRFFINGVGDRYQFDLPMFGVERLRRVGVAQAEWTKHCTHTDEKNFFSYRRATQRRESDYGRMLSSIRL